jgi:hypothetical protein
MLLNRIRHDAHGGLTVREDAQVTDGKVIAERSLDVGRAVQTEGKRPLVDHIPGAVRQRFEDHPLIRLRVVLGNDGILLGCPCIIARPMLPPDQADIWTIRQWPPPDDREPYPMDAEFLQHSAFD